MSSCAWIYVDIAFGWSPNELPQKYMPSSFESPGLASLLAFRLAFDGMMYSERRCRRESLLSCSWAYSKESASTGKSNCCELVVVLILDGDILVDVGLCVAFESRGVCYAQVRVLVSMKL